MEMRLKSPSKSRKQAARSVMLIVIREEKNGKIRIHEPDSDTGIRSHTASDSVFHHQAGCEKRDQRTEKRKHIIVDRNLS